MYVAAHHLWIARRRAELGLHRIFGAMACVLVVYGSVHSLAQTESQLLLDPYVDRLFWVCEMLFAGLLMAFVGRFTGLNPGRLRRPVTVALAVAAALPLILPNGIRSGAALGLNSTMLPWGEQVWLVNAPFGIAYYTLIILVAIGLAWCFVAAWRAWHATRSGRQLALLLSLGVIALAVANNIAADVIHLPTVPVIAHSFILLAAIMGHVLSAEVVRAGDLERRLRNAEQFAAVGRLAGGVAHNFGNVLTGVLGHAELLLDVPQAREQAKAIAAAAERGTALTRQLLAFSRGAPMSSRPNPVGGGDAHEILREVAGLIRAANSGIDVRLELAPGPAPVVGDTARLHAALLNLAVNARDAMAGMGTLRLSTARRGPPDGAVLRHSALPVPLLEISVSDSGSGIPAATLPRIFDLQFSTKGNEGSGLGLAQVDEMVRDVGGCIVVETAPSRGTNFRLWLPLAGFTLGDVRAPVGARVLLVAGGSSLDQMLTTGLSQLGYEIARLGRDDVIHLHAAVIDIDHAGDEGLAQIRTMQDKLPVVVLADDPSDWPAGDATVVLHKPAGLSDLSYALRQATSGGRRKTALEGQPAQPR